MVLSRGEKARIPSLVQAVPATCARALLPNPSFHTVYVNLTATVIE